MGQLSPVPFRTLSRVCDFPELRDALGGETYSQARMEKLGGGGVRWSFPVLLLWPERDRSR